MSLHLPSFEFKRWRDSARLSLSQGVPPERFDILLPGLCVGDSNLAVPSPMVPGNFLKFAKRVAMYNAEDRWILLYSLLWRMHHGEAGILDMHDDPAVARAWHMYKAVGRDMMKMRVFVRFQNKHGLRVAWYKPDHFITEELAAFFVKLNRGQIWLLHTPDLTVRWNMKELEFTLGLSSPPRFLTDDHEDVWLRYYQAQFDPRRERILSARRSGSSRSVRHH